MSVVVRCSGCGAALTAPLEQEGIAALDRGATGVSSLPRGVLVVDPDADGSVVVRPRDLLDGAVVVPGAASGCCGLDGADGPNQACAACGAVLGTARSDCSTPHEVRLSPDAVQLAAP